MIYIIIYQHDIELMFLTKKWLKTSTIPKGWIKYDLGVHVGDDFFKINYGLTNT